VIFQPTSVIDERLAEIVADIESREIGLRVVSACVYKLPYVRMAATLLVQNPRRFNVLEEFVLRAAFELDPRPTRRELAALLGLDDLFVRATCQSLEQMEAIEVDDQDRLRLTSKGREFYQQGRIPRPPERKAIKLAYQGVTGEIAVWKPLPETEDGLSILPGLLDQDSNELEAAAMASVTLQQVIDCTGAAGLGLHLPDEGRVIAGVEAVTAEECGEYPCGVLVVQDTVVQARQADNVFVRAFNLSTGSRDFALEHVLAGWLQEERIRLDQLVPGQLELAALLESDEEEPLHAQQLEQLYQDQAAAAREQVQAGQAASAQVEVELLHDQAIRPRFMQVIEHTQHTLLIISPWITSEVVDRDFKKRLGELAQRGVLVVIGWGIARDYGLEERVPPQSLLDSLRAIHTPDGVPAVVVWWLGNQHRKDVLADYAVYMMGSHNWLSYRGDRLPRGETTFYATQAELIRQAADYIGPLFAQVAGLGWDQASQASAIDQSELARCCATWVAARKPEEAMARVLDLVRDNPALAPTAFELMRVICSALAYLPPDDLVTMRVLELMGQVVSEMFILAQPLSELDKSGFVKGFKRLLSRYAESHRSDLARFLEDQKDAWEEMGLIVPGEKAVDAVKRLDAEGTRVEKGKRGNK